MQTPRFPLTPRHPRAILPMNFHTQTFPNGEVMNGFKSAEMLEMEADMFFKHGVAGKTVLDIGAVDGFFSFEAERRGASRVLATDHFSWGGPGWVTRQGFEYAHTSFGSNVEALEIDVPDHSPEQIGTFDVVLFLGVLYHVKDPLRCIETVASVASDLVVCDTEVALDRIDEPVMQYFLGDEMGGDPTNFWAPNTFCLQQMFREFGFSRFEVVDHPHRPRNGDRGRVVMHAWR